LFENSQKASRAAQNALVDHMRPACETPHPTQRNRKNKIRSHITLQQVS